MDDDFKNHPMTIGELRSEKTQRASDWTPRELLISTLREIDAGNIEADMCVVVMGKLIANGEGETRVRQSTPSIYATLGLLERAKYVIQHED